MSKSIIKSNINFITYTISKILKLNYDVIIGTSYFYGFLGLIAKFLRNKKLITVIHDLGLLELKTRSLIKSLKFFVYKFTVKFSDAVIVPNKNLVKKLKIYFNINEKKHILHTTWDRHKKI